MKGQADSHPSPGEVRFTPVQEVAHLGLAAEHIPRLVDGVIANLRERRSGAMETPARIDVPNLASVPTDVVSNQPRTRPEAFDPGVLNSVCPRPTPAPT